MQTWTLDMMRRFVLTHETRIPCPVCHEADLVYRPRLTISPKWNDDIQCEEARVECGAELYDQECKCLIFRSLELPGCLVLARMELLGDLAEFLRSQPLADPVEMSEVY